MARTQAADYDDRREAIVEIAARLYGETGFLGSSIADLAKASGISKSLLYHYFSSKEDILFEIMIGHVEALRASADEVSDLPDSADRLKALTHGFMKLYANASYRHKVLINDLDKLPVERRSAIIEAERRLLDIVDGIIVDRATTLGKNKGKRRALTMLYFGMINWTHTWFDPAGEINGDQLADMVVDLFLKGLPS
ncbi:MULTISPECIES: TetR/AcrR family transcriptional regulator [Sphingomonadales]|uniref:TetR family transcriptional regulator n=2 Tax=Sphingomonadaceae TaxID=41297 RepID=A0A0A7PAN8_9SPHN|nr:MULTISPECIES: TetR/AcrR family transcriptional regulator [Sphingomonadaceae]AJA07136.1 TetR family transcriptional regulator [Sphingopyxis fribergensis]QJR02847.1 TetR/AcrR family transcriptional regulator [Sphingobium yanoikuyae]SEJ47573.1 transcriptional regulator, TetR family [Sphingobium sp. AP50]